MITHELKRATALRFFFALWVYLSHCDFLFGTDRPFYKNFAAYGYVGVGFFFILSGFILSYVYRNALLQGTTSFRDFILRRIFRLYPVYFLTLILALVVEGRGEPSAWLPRLASHVFMIQSFVPQEHVYFAFNSPSWSVSDEMFFYLLFPLFILYFRKAVIVYAIAMAVVFLTKFAMPQSDFADPHYFFYINPLVRLCDFILGVSLYALYERKIELPKYSTIIGLVLMIVFFMFRAKVPDELLYSAYFYIPVSVIILAAADPSQNSFADAFLGNRFVVYLGRISYGIYLYHILVLRYVGGIISHFFPGTHAMLTMAICTMVLMATAVFSYEFIETPLNRKLRSRWLQKE